MLCCSETCERKVRMELRGKFKEEPENQGVFLLDTEADDKLSEHRQWFLFLDTTKQTSTVSHS